MPPLCLQGLLLIGPTLHFWYGSLGTIVKATGNTGAIMRLSLDQLCFAPVFISSETLAVAWVPFNWAWVPFNWAWMPDQQTQSLPDGPLQLLCLSRGARVPPPHPHPCRLLSVPPSALLPVLIPHSLPCLAAIVSLLMVLEGKGPEVVPTLKRNLPDMVSEGRRVSQLNYALWLLEWVRGSCMPLLPEPSWVLWVPFRPHSLHIAQSWHLLPRARSSPAGRCGCPSSSSTSAPAPCALHQAALLTILAPQLAPQVKSNWMLWVPFQFINFRFVPPHLQVGSVLCSACVVGSRHEAAAGRMPPDAGCRLPAAAGCHLLPPLLCCCCCASDTPLALRPTLSDHPHGGGPPPSCRALPALLTFCRYLLRYLCAPAQVLMSNLVALAWNVYMSYKAHH